MLPRLPSAERASFRRLYMSLSMQAGTYSPTGRGGWYVSVEVRVYTMYVCKCEKDAGRVFPDSRRKLAEMVWFHSGDG